MLFPSQAIISLGCLMLAAPLLAQPVQSGDPLDAALGGHVVTTDELLQDLVRQPAGTTAGLLRRVAQQQERSSQPELGRLMGNLVALPQEVLADRRDLPNGALTVERWTRGLGVGLDVLAHMGTSEHLSTVRELLQAPASIPKELLAIQEGGIQTTLGRILLRDQEAFDQVAIQYREFPEWATPALLRAVSGTKELGALHALPKLLRRRSRFDQYVLTQIASIARFARAPLSETDLGRIRDFLQAEDSDLRRTAAQALGFLDDADSVLELIRLLEDDSPDVRHAGYAALRLITAMTMDPGYRRWMNWHERESRWWKHEAHRHVSFLGSGESAGRVHALRELGSRRLFRREIAPSITPLLATGSDETVRLALSALTSLRANDPQTLAAMERLLGHRAGDIQQQAQASLRLITRRAFTTANQASGEEHAPRAR